MEKTLAETLCIMPKETRDPSWCEENQVFHFPYALEKKMFYLFASGNEDAFLKFFEHNVVTLGNTTDSDVSTIKYSIVIFGALAARVCIENGMPEIAAYNFSDMLIASADKMENFSDLSKSKDILQMMMLKMKEYRFCGVKNPRIQKAVKYIFEHLHDPLGRDEVAAIAGFSSCYLSTCFRKEMGITLNEFIQRARIGEAKLLLTCTDYSISQIAYTLQFASCSYFCSCFKKFVGQTPIEYSHSSSTFP